MARFACGLGYVLLGFAALLAVVGLSTWPPGGLMFALPFVFFIPAAFFGLIGGALLWFGKRKTAAKLEPDDPPPSGSV